MVVTEIRRTVGAYSILVSVNPLIKDDVVRTATVTKELLADYRTEYGSSVFSSDDAGFIELRHDFKFKGGKQSSRGPSITIKAYDVGLSFLTDMYYDFTERSLRSIRDQKSKEAVDLRGYFEKLKIAEDKVKGQQDVLNSIAKESTEAARILGRQDIISAGGVQIDWTIGGKRDKVEEIINRYAEEEEKLGGLIKDKDVILQELQAIAGQRSLPKVYIMYGTGDELEHWAGPFECYLGEIKHDNDGITETTTFRFAVDLATEQFEDIVVHDIETKEEKVKFFNRVAVPIMAYDWVVRSGEGRHESVDFHNHPDNFHDCIVKLISNYLFHIGIKNNLVALPNLDVMLASLIETAYISVIHNDYKLSWAAEKLRKLRPEYAEEAKDPMNVDPGGPRAPWRNLRGVEKEKNIKAFVNSLFAARFSGTHAPAGMGLGQVAGPGPQYTEIALVESLQSFFAPLGQGSKKNQTWKDYLPDAAKFTFWNTVARDIIQTVFNAIGMASVKSEGKSSLKDPAILTQTDETERKDQRNWFKRLPTQSFAPEMEPDGPKVSMLNPFSPKGVAGKVSEWDFNVIEHNTIMKLTFKAAENQEDPITDWIKPLHNLIDGINRCTESNVILLQEGYETDSGVQERMKLRFGGGTYVGYVYAAKTGTGLRIDETPPYIFGDRELIKLFVYGDYWRAKKNITEFADWDYLSERGVMTEMIYNPQRSTGIGVPHLRDPFWKEIGRELGYSLLSTYGRSGYFESMYAHLHPTGGGLSLGYYNGYLEDWKQLKSMLPDEFGYALNEGELKSLFDEDYPLFLANTEGANVLSYSFDVNKFLYGSLFGSVQEIFYNVSKRYLTGPGSITAAGAAAGGTAGGAAAAGTGLTADEREAKIREIMGSLRARSAVGGSGKGLASTVAPSVDMDAVADHLAQIMHMEHSTGTNIVVRKDRASSVMSFLMLFLDIFERQYIGTIKTLPFYELSQLSSINKTILAILKSTRRVGPRKIDPTTGKAPSHQVADFLSGWYRILGFQHVITSSDAFSEFSVVKDIISEFSNES